MAYASLATRNNSGLHPNFRGLGFLGDTNPTLTPQAALQQAIQQSSGLKLNPRDFQNSAFLSSAEQQIAAGAFNVAAYSPECSGQAAPNLNMFQTASGLALGTTAAAVGILGPSGAGVIAASAVPVIGWVIAGAGVIVGLISAIFQHHAAAVRRDLSFGCSALPAVNNAFSVIYKGVQSGQIHPADAAGALDHIVSEFQSAGGAAINYSPWCNSNCEMEVILKGMVLYWKAQYTAMAAQQAAAQSAGAQSSQGGSTISEIFSGSSAPGSGFSAIPGWAWLVAAAFGLWAVS